MTVNEIIDLTDDLSDERCSTNVEAVQVSISEKIFKIEDTPCRSADQLVSSLMNLPELPSSPVYDSDVTPPKPHLGICKAIGSNCLTLVWHIGPETPSVKLKKYELWICFDTYRDWKKVGDIEALAPPMSCTLSQIKSDVVNFFAIRAVDIEGRPGPFSLPCNFIQQS